MKIREHVSERKLPAVLLRRAVFWLAAGSLGLLGELHLSVVSAATGLCTAMLFRWSAINCGLYCKEWLGCLSRL